jgi:DnaJ-domain-containing protein 1
LAAARLDCESALYHVPELARAKRIQQQADELIAQNDAALRKDYYRILGLERGRVSEAEVYRAYNDLMNKYSPDKVADSDRPRVMMMMKDIQAVLLFSIILAK